MPMFKPITDQTDEKFIVTNKPVMESATDVLRLLNKSDNVTIKGKDELCPTVVSIANILTQNFLKGCSSIEKISLDSESLDDGRLISTIEIRIKKTDNQ